ncbi:MAG: hypothetical protein ACK5Z2_06760, partial [Bacteroidota bacterium]
MNIRFSFFAAVLLVILLFPAEGFALKRYWRATAASNWNNTANWSATAAGATGQTVPTTNDTAYFTVSGANGNCTLNAVITVRRMEIAGYTGTIIHQANALTTGATGSTANDGWVQSSGVFQGGSGSIIMRGNVLISGGDFRSTSATLQLERGISLTGTAIFRHNNGLVQCVYGSVNTGSVTWSSTGSPRSFYTLEFNSNNTKTWTIATNNVLPVVNELKTDGTWLKVVNGGFIDLSGNVNLQGVGAFKGTTVLRMIGTGNQSITGTVDNGVPHLLPLVINKATGTVNFIGPVATASSITRTAGAVNFGTSRFIFTEAGVSPAITGRFTGSNAFHKISVEASTGNMLVAVNDTVQINDSLHFRASGIRQTALTKTANGYLRLKGNLVISNTVAGIASQLMYCFDGTANQRISGSTTAGCTYLGDVLINKASGNLDIEGHVVVSGNWQYSTGSVNAANSTVYLRVMNSTARVVSGSMTFGN